MKSINDDIMKFIRERQAAGERKYGKTIERDDLRPSQWAQHALEEMADGIQYAARCVETVERLEYAANLALAEFTAQHAKMAEGPEKERIGNIARKLVIALDGNGEKPAGLLMVEEPAPATFDVMDTNGSFYSYDQESRGLISANRVPWDKAPDLAMWAAMDSDGEWWWFNMEPRIGPSSIAWIVDDMRHQHFACSFRPDWTQSKQRRPE